MKPVSIHPLSALAGAGLLAIMLLAAGAVQVSGGVQQIPTCPPGPVHVVGIADPNDIVLLREEDGPYTVPAGKVLVVTGLGVEGPSNEPAELTVDGAIVASTQAFYMALPSPASRRALARS